MVFVDDNNLTLCQLLSRLQHIYYVRVDLNPKLGSTLSPSGGGFGFSLQTLAVWIQKKLKFYKLKIGIFQVFWVCDTCLWIRILGSVLWITDPDPTLLGISFQDVNKMCDFFFFLLISYCRHINISRQR
jgi:hypothetical protein